MGKSGLAVYKNLLSRGTIPIFYDDNNLELDGLERYVINAEYIVVSPSISPQHLIFKFAKFYKKKIIGEVEYAYLSGIRNSCIIGITGTNGKTTVTTMLGHIFGTSDSTICGNVGIPATDVIMHKKAINVIELSSFQLMTIDKFKPNIACILNIAPDHIDYHGSYSEYIRCKMKITKNLTKDDFLVINSDDIKLNQIKSIAKVKRFSIKDKNADCFYDGKSIFLNINGKRQFILDVALFGEILEHNIQNILAVLTILNCMNKNIESAVSKLLTYEYQPYRMKYVGRKNGTIIYNDSKSTNVASTISAMNSLKKYKSISLILGGRYKKESFRDIFSKFSNIAEVLIFGESKSEIYSDAIILGQKNVKIFNSLEEVVIEVSKTKAEVILFSPGCASFDMFTGYMQRGEIFEKLMNKYFFNKSYW